MSIDSGLLGIIAELLNVMLHRQNCFPLNVDVCARISSAIDASPCPLLPRENVFDLTVLRQQPRISELFYIYWF